MHYGKAACPGSGWRLFFASTGKQLRVFYLQAGLALLVLVTAAIFTAAAWIEPALFGGQAGTHRADLILLFCGAPAIVLAALYVAFLRPGAVLAAYVGCLRIRFDLPREPDATDESRKSASARRVNVYWWTVLLRFATGAALGAAGLALSRWLVARFSQDSWSVAVVWTLCVMLFWQSRMPLALALTAAMREPVDGLDALRRGLRLYRRARDYAVNAALRTLLAATLPLIGVTVLSAWIAAGDAFLQGSIMAFLLALLNPLFRLLVVAFDTAVYAEAVRERVTIKRLTYGAKRLRARRDRRKGQGS